MSQKKLPQVYNNNPSEEEISRALIDAGLMVDSRSKFRATYFNRVLEPTIQSGSNFGNVGVTSGHDPFNQSEGVHLSGFSDTGFIDQENQGYTETALKVGGRFLNTTLTTAATTLANIGSAIYAIPHFFNSDFSTAFNLIWNNQVTKGINDIKASLDDYLTIHSSEAMQAEGLYNLGSLFTTGQGYGQIADLLGFSAGAALAGQGFSKFFSTIGDALGKTGNAISTNTNMIASSVLTSGGEAAIEALHTTEEFLTKGDSDRMGKYMRDLKALEENPNLTPEEKEAVLADIKLQYTTDSNLSKEAAKRVGNLTYGMNMAILSVNNYNIYAQAWSRGLKRDALNLQNRAIKSLDDEYAKGLLSHEEYLIQKGKILSNKNYYTDLAIRNQKRGENIVFTDTEKKLLADLPYKVKDSKAWTLAKASMDPLYEGMEEMSQAIASNYSSSYYDSIIRTIVANKNYNYTLDTGRDNVKAYMDSIGFFFKSAIKTISDPDAWYEFALGALVGGLGTPIINTNNKAKIEWQGFLPGKLMMANNNYNALQTQVNKLNEALTKPEIQRQLRHGLDMAAIDDTIQQHLKDGNWTKAQELEEVKEVLMQVHMINSGKAEDLFNHFKEMGNKSDEEIKQLIEQNTHYDSSTNSFTGIFVNDDGKRMSVEEARNYIKEKANNSLGIISTHERAIQEFEVYEHLGMDEDTISKLASLRVFQNKLKEGIIKEDSFKELRTSILEGSTILSDTNLFNPDGTVTQELQDRLDKLIKFFEDLGTSTQTLVKELKEIINKLQNTQVSHNDLQALRSLVEEADENANAANMSSFLTEGNYKNSVIARFIESKGGKKNLTEEDNKFIDKLRGLGLNTFINAEILGKLAEISDRVSSIPVEDVTQEIFDGIFEEIANSIGTNRFISNGTYDRFASINKIEEVIRNTLLDKVLDGEAANILNNPSLTRSDITQVPEDPEVVAKLRKVLDDDFRNNFGSFYIGYYRSAAPYVIGHSKKEGVLEKIKKEFNLALDKSTDTEAWELILKGLHLPENKEVQKSAYLTTLLKRFGQYNNLAPYDFVGNQIPADLLNALLGTSLVEDYDIDSVYKEFGALLEDYGNFIDTIKGLDRSKLSNEANSLIESTLKKDNIDKVQEAILKTKELFNIGGVIAPKNYREKAKQAIKVKLEELYKDPNTSDKVKDIIEEIKDKDNILNAILEEYEKGTDDISTFNSNVGEAIFDKNKLASYTLISKLFQEVLATIPEAALIRTGNLQVTPTTLVDVSDNLVKYFTIIQDLFSGTQDDIDSANGIINKLEQTLINLKPQSLSTPEEEMWNLINTKLEEFYKALYKGDIDKAKVLLNELRTKVKENLSSIDASSLIGRLDSDGNEELERILDITINSILEKAEEVLEEELKDKLDSTLLVKNMPSSISKREIIKALSLNRFSTDTIRDILSNTSFPHTDFINEVLSLITSPLTEQLEIDAYTKLFEGITKEDIEELISIIEKSILDSNNSLSVEEDIFNAINDTLNNKVKSITGGIQANISSSKYEEALSTIVSNIGKALLNLMDNGSILTTTLNGLIQAENLSNTISQISSLNTLYQELSGEELDEYVDYIRQENDKRLRLAYSNVLKNISIPSYGLSETIKLSDIEALGMDIVSILQDILRAEPISFEEDYKELASKIAEAIKDKFPISAMEVNNVLQFIIKDLGGEALRIAREIEEEVKEKIEEEKEKEKQRRDIPGPDADPELPKGGEGATLNSGNGVFEFIIDSVHEKRSVRLSSTDSQGEVSREVARFLESVGAYQYVSEGNLKEGDTITFTVEEDYVNNRNTNDDSPVIFIRKGTQIVGALSLKNSHPYSIYHFMFKKAEEMYKNKQYGEIKSDDGNSYTSSITKVNEGDLIFDSSKPHSANWFHNNRSLIEEGLRDKGKNPRIALAIVQKDRQSHDLTFFSSNNNISENDVINLSSISQDVPMVLIKNLEGKYVAIPTHLPNISNSKGSGTANLRSKEFLEIYDSLKAFLSSLKDIHTANNTITEQGLNNLFVKHIKPYLFIGDNIEFSIRNDNKDGDVQLMVQYKATTLDTSSEWGEDVNTVIANFSKENFKLEALTERLIDILSSIGVSLNVDVQEGISSIGFKDSNSIIKLAGLLQTNLAYHAIANQSFKFAPITSRGEAYNEMQNKELNSNRANTESPRISTPTDTEYIQVRVDNLTFHIEHSRRASTTKILHYTEGNDTTPQSLPYNIKGDFLISITRGMYTLHNLMEALKNGDLESFRNRHPYVNIMNAENGDYIMRASYRGIVTTFRIDRTTFKTSLPTIERANGRTNRMGTKVLEANENPTLIQERFNKLLEESRNEYPDKNEVHYTYKRKRYYRVTNTLYTSPNFNGQRNTAQKAGVVMDIFVREVLKNRTTPITEEEIKKLLKSYSEINLSDNEISALVKSLNTVVAYTKKGFSIITDEIFLYDDELLVGGTTDIILYNEKDGNFIIVDIKTTKNDTIRGDTRIRHAKQLLIYKELLRRRMGIENPNTIETKTLDLHIRYDQRWDSNLDPSNIKLNKAFLNDTVDAIIDFNHVRISAKQGLDAYALPEEESNPFEEKSLFEELGFDNEMPSDFDDVNLRLVTQESSYTIQDLRVELAVLQRILPNSDLSTIVRIHRGLINAGNSGLAWGTYYRGMITLSDKSAAGTLYHEAFHLIFDSMLSQRDKEALLQETLLRTGITNRVELEEFLAEEFREYVQSREEKPSWGKRVLSFFKSLFSLSGIWKRDSRVARSIYSRAYNGKLSPISIKSKEDARIDELLDRQVETIMYNGRPIMAKLYDSNTKSRITISPSNSQLRADNIRVAIIEDIQDAINYEYNYDAVYVKGSEELLLFQNALDLLTENNNKKYSYTNDPIPIGSSQYSESLKESITREEFEALNEELQDNIKECRAF